MSSKSIKVADDSFVSHEEAAKRIAQAVSKVTTKKEARKLLRKAGILNKHYKLVKALA